MKGRSIKVFDDSYSDFLDTLQKLGELGRLNRLIDCLESPEVEPDPDLWIQADLKTNRTGALHAFWDRGWIEIRETYKERKHGPVRQYQVQIRLDKIGQHFEQERMARSAMLDKKAAIAIETTAVPRAEA
jgi:predicted transcriptional regulator